VSADYYQSNSAFEFKIYDLNAGTNFCDLKATAPTAAPTVTAFGENFVLLSWEGLWQSTNEGTSLIAEYGNAPSGGQISVNCWGYNAAQAE